jgi:hypothetical protein
VVERIDYAAFVKQHGFKTAPFEFDTAGEAGWTRAYDGHVKLFHLQ